jgi:SAM-dependent methyltransferase
MMFGLEEAFEYSECGMCGALQLTDIPADMGRFYPKDYYSFTNQAQEKYSLLKGFLKRARARYAIEGKGVLGAVVAKVEAHWPYFDWFREARLTLQSTILDVGCGRGDSLLRFASDGFRSIQGIDPLIEKDLSYSNGVRVYRRWLSEMTGEFDCVFLQHSFEHMANPQEAIREICRLVRPGGVALIAIPVAGCWAWEEYGVHWWQIDAPRHFVIPSRKSMELLAAQVGFVLENVLFDSRIEQMVASELYRRGISLQTLEREGSEAFFSADEIEAFQAKTEELNRTGRGDQACFILRKKDLR